MRWLAALKADDDAALVAIFGDEHKDAIVDPDRAAANGDPREDRRGDADAIACSRSRAPIVACW